MAYHIEGTDIVINGFEKGIAESPYSGIADMRNVELISVPGEASVQYANQTATLPPVHNAVAYTAAASTDRLTWAGPNDLYEGCALKLITNSANGLSTGVVYYARNIVGSTFQVTLAPGTTSQVNITGDGAGTFTTYQYGNQRGVGGSQRVPVSYFVDRIASLGSNNSIVIVDASNYVWAMLSGADSTGVPAGALIFLGNIGGIGASSTIESGVAIWNGYLLLLSGTTSDYAKVDTLWGSGPAAAWNYSWESITTNAPQGRIGVLSSQEDGNLYWISADGVGSLIQQPGLVFDPGNSATYAITSDAVQVPVADEATCIAELGSVLLIGGQNSFIYVWDKISLGFTGLLNIPDTYTVAIVAASQNAYVFSGNRGRIYITNGSGIDLYKKLPDMITGLTGAMPNTAPFIQWQDANFSRNQLIFGFTSRNAGGALEDTTAGAWAIDLDSDALRELNVTTNASESGYTGYTPMVVERPQPLSGNPSVMLGTELAVGWCDLSNGYYGVDIGSSAPYANWEAYIITDMIPVGTFLDPFSPSQLEWKTSVPITNTEGVRISYRANLKDNFTLVGSTTTSGGVLVSDLYQANFQKVQWAQFLIELKSAQASPSFVRLTEMRVRDWPSGKNSSGATNPMTGKPIV